MFARTDTDRWPLAMAHLENSKLTPSTAAWKTEPIARFAADPDLVVESTQARRVYPGARRVALPRSRAWGGPSVWRALRTRRTVRAFSPRPVPTKALARLLGAAAGVTGEIPVPGTAGLTQKLRAWPSAGALYPIELHAASSEGAFHYDPVDHALETLVEGDARDRAKPHLLGMGRETDAPLYLILAGAPDRTMRKYGERGYRFLWLDAGHLAQNLILAATALGLGSCPIGGFYEDPLARALGIDARETVLYVIAVGYRADR